MTEHEEPRTDAQASSPRTPPQWLTVHIGDNRVVLDTLPAESVHCVVTSPPYWGLRDYGTATWDGGDEGCEHRVPATGSTMNKGNNNREGKPFPTLCGVCGARRIDAQLGLEPTPDEYVANMVDVFRKVRRVLRDDGTLWLNLGDSYAATGGHTGYGSSSMLRSQDQKDARNFQSQTVPPGLKPKDLVGIPWRVAFALQADGWYLRSDIIWSKPNPMPESVTDRPTKSHEMVFLLSKEPRYYWDQEAVREPVSPHSDFKEPVGTVTPWSQGAPRHDKMRLGNGSRGDPAGRNIRSVWTIPTQPYPGSHFAVFPPALVEPCVKAGTSERGVCPECGAPWERVVERGNSEHHCRAGCGHIALDSDRFYDGGRYGGITATGRDTGEWRPTCAHDAEPVPAVVLDPFAGSGTVGVVANKLSRRAVLIDLNPDYLGQIERRNQQAPLGLTA